MKAIIFGADGYLGSNFAIKLEEYGFHVLRVTRSVFSFGAHDQSQLERIIEDFSPDLVVNALGQIDSQDQATHFSMYSAIFVPTLYLFRYFQSAEVGQPVTVLTFGSESEGQPRQKYPIYAALKTAEGNLVLTAREFFGDSNIRWLRLKLPRLDGGLGLSGVPVNESIGKVSFEIVWEKALNALSLDQRTGKKNG